MAITDWIIRDPECSNVSKNILGYKPRPLRESIIDTIYWLEKN